MADVAIATEYSIYDQLRDDCDCLDEFDDSVVDELIGLVSMATCWTQEPCDTFLFGERKEIIELPDCLDNCGVIEFEPFYRPFDKESIKISFVEQEGLKETITPITEYLYSEIDDSFRIAPPLPGCACKPCTCGCEPTYKMVVTYDAGYQRLPDCLIPIFCEALKYIIEYKKCDCECACPTCPTDDDGDEATIEYEHGMTISDRLRWYFTTMLTKQYKRQLSLISLCRNANRLWGKVV